MVEGDGEERRAGGRLCSHTHAKQCLIAHPSPYSARPATLLQILVNHPSLSPPNTLPSSRVLKGDSHYSSNPSLPSFFHFSPWHSCA